MADGESSRMAAWSDTGWCAAAQLLRIPLLEKVEYLHLNVLTIPLEIKRAYTLKGVPVSVKAVANVKIRGDESSLQAAADDSSA